MISVHHNWGDPRAQAARANAEAAARLAETRRLSAQVNPQGASLPFTPDQRPQPGYWYGAEWTHQRTAAEQRDLRDRFDQFVPRVASAGARTRAEQFMEGLLPPGAQLSPFAGQGLDRARQAANRQADGFSNAMPGAQYGGSGGSFHQPQRPYQPEFESPDRQNYPVHRNLANIYWRLFYKLDPIVGNGIDMYAELPWSDVQLTGEGVDGEVKDTFERMWENTNARAVLPYMVREFMVMGEVAVHNFFDNNAGVWSYINILNPDQLEVIHTPFIEMDPIVRFKPDNRLQQVLHATSPAMQAVRESMPPDLVNMLMSGQAVDLHPLNLTYIPRKMHPYDVRGTSILSRMWRAFMYEDAIFNASIATARRHAGPLKVAKMGDRATNWIPDPSQQAHLLQLLAQAEIDVNAWIVYHYGVEFELVGSTDRVMTIDKHWDLIERIKLIALGISKAFLHGEVTYASAASGLTVFLQRLKAIREMFESSWIYPKFLRPVAEINEFIKPTQAEASSASQAGPYIKTRRGRTELLEDNRYIVPTIEWARQLDPSIEQAQITAVTALQGMGITFSKQFLTSLVGRDYEEELEQSARELRIEKKILQENSDLGMELQQRIAPAGGPGGGGPGMLPGLPPSAMGFGGDDDFGDMGGPPPGPEPADAGGFVADPGSEGAPSGWQRPDLWADSRSGNWDEPVVRDLVRVFEGEPADEEIWDRMLRDHGVAKVQGQDADVLWDAVEDFLMAEGYPPRDISHLEDILKAERVLGGDPPAAEPSARVSRWNASREAAILDGPNVAENPSLLTGPLPRRRR